MWRRAGIALVVLLGAAATSVFLLGRSEQALHWATAKLQAASNGRLNLTGGAGALFGPLSFAEIRYEDERVLVTLRGVHFDWQPLMLLRGQAQWNSIDVEQIDATLKGVNDDAPTPAPESLRAPLPYAVESFHVGKLAIITARRRFEVSNIRGTVRGESDTHALRLDSADGVWGALQAEVTLGTTSPFALGGQLRMDTRAGGLPCAPEAGLSGSLLSAQLQIRCDTDGSSLRADLALKPFAYPMTWEATIDGRALDAHRWLSRAPRTQVDIQGKAQGLTNGEMTGRLTADNKSPSTEDAAPRPWEHAQISIDTHAARLTLTGALDGTGGRIAARAVLNPAEEQPLREIDLVIKDFDPRRWHPSWPHAVLQVEGTARVDATIDGNVTVRNDAPGTAAGGALPLSSLSARLAGAPDSVRFEAIEARLPRGGIVDGQGTLISGERLSVTLKARRLDLRILHDDMKAIRLDGSIAFDVDATGQRLRANLRHRGYRVNADVRHQGGAVTIEQASLRAGGGELALQGKFSLLEPQPFELSGDLSRFNPAALGRFPSARINARLSAAGQRLPVQQGRFDFRFGRSVWRGQSLRGRGTLLWTPTGISQANVALTVGVNRLSLQGGFGDAEDALTFQIDAPRLASLTPSLNGKLALRGKLSGKRASPALDLSVQASAIKFPGAITLSTLSGSAQLGAGMRAPLTLDANFSGLRTPWATLDAGSLTATGERQRHVLTLAARNDVLDVTVRLGGGLGEDWRWRGMIEAFSNRGLHAIDLRTPASLELGKDNVMVRDARVRFDESEIRLAELSYFPDGRLVSSGAITGLPAALVQSLMAPALRLDNALTLGAQWNINVGASANGSLYVWRQTGEVSLLTPSPVALGIERLSLRATVSDNDLRAEGNVTGTRLGTIDLNLGTRVVRQSGKWGISGASPFNLIARLNAPSLTWLGPWFSPTAITDGRVQADVAVTGSIANPSMSGTLLGDKLRLTLLGEGVDLREGVVRAIWRDNGLNIERATFRGGAGSLNMTGTVGLNEASPQAQIRIGAEKLTAVSRPDQVMVVTGILDLSLKDALLSAHGRLGLDEALVLLPTNDSPTLSDDVVLSGREPATARSKRDAPVQMQAKVELDLGDKFVVMGRGVDTRLTGTVLLEIDPGVPMRASGQVQTADGSYRAYGQRLAIERGLINFSGPIDNPRLDVLAMRTNQDVEAGVAVTGTARKPVINLVSRPPLSESEKLSWLVLGYGLESAQKNELALLSTATRALFSGGDNPGLDQQLAKALGVSEIGLRGSGELETSVLTVSNRISSRASISYEQALDGASNLLAINYRLSRRWSVRVLSGSDSAADFFYTLSFD